MDLNTRRVLGFEELIQIKEGIHEMAKNYSLANVEKLADC